MVSVYPSVVTHFTQLMHHPFYLLFCLISFFISVFSVHEWIRLNKEWLTFLYSGMNPGTWKNLSCHIKTYWSFANHFQFSLLPLQTTSRCLFAAHLAVQGKSHATIKNYLNSLSTCGQLQGYPPLNLQNFFIYLTLRGILQMVKLKLSIARPLSLTMLNKMVNHVDFDHTIQVATWVAIVLSFHLLLCKSNLVPTSVAEFKPAQQLQCYDIHFHCGMALVNIKWSKTRQIGNRVTMPLLKDKGPACPVAALKKLFLLVQASPSDPLFMFYRTKAYSQSHLSIFTYSSLMLYLRHLLEKAGYEPYRYSCHSLRRGGASHAFANNTLADLTKHLGDWRSECYQQYLEDDLALRLSAAGGCLL